MAVAALAVALAAAAAAAGVFLASARTGAFVYDDVKCIVENPVVTAPALSWPALLASDLWGTPLAHPEVGPRAAPSRAAAVSPASARLITPCAEPQKLAPGHHAVVLAQPPLGGPRPGALSRRQRRRPRAQHLARRPRGLSGPSARARRLERGGPPRHCLVALGGYGMAPNPHPKAPRAMRWQALATMALFAVHPMHAEAVSNITNRAEIFALFGQLLAFICYVQSVRFPSRTRAYHAGLTGLSLAAALFAALSKESGFMIAPLLVALDLLVHGVLSLPVARYTVVALASRIYCPADSAKAGKGRSAPAAQTTSFNLPGVARARALATTLFVVLFMAVRLYIQVTGGT
jgi:hypothetical protein